MKIGNYILTDLALVTTAQSLLKVIVCLCILQIGQ